MEAALSLPARPGNLWFGFYLVCKSGRSPSTNNDFTQPFPPNTDQKLFPLSSLPGFTLPICLPLIMVAITQNIYRHNLCIALCFEISVRVHVSVEYTLAGCFSMLSCSVSVYVYCVCMWAEMCVPIAVCIFACFIYNHLLYAKH